MYISLKRIFHIFSEYDFDREEDIRRYLEENGCRFEEIPGEVDLFIEDETLDNLFGDKVSDAKYYLTICMKPFNFPIITDNFGDGLKNHETRREWRRSLPAKVGLYLDRNKIRKNNIGSKILVPLSILRGLTINANLRAKISELYEKYYSLYYGEAKKGEAPDYEKTFSTKQKIEFALELHNALLKLFVEDFGMKAIS